MYPSAVFVHDCSVVPPVHAASAHVGPPQLPLLPPLPLPPPLLPEPAQPPPAPIVKQTGAPGAQQHDAANPLDESVQFERVEPG